MGFIVKPVTGAVVLAGLYAAAGYIGVPMGVRWAVENVAPEALGARSASVGEVHFDPWSWQIEIKDLAVKSANSDGNMISLKRLAADLSSSTLTEMAPVVESVDVDGLDVHLTASEDNNKEAKSAAKDASEKTQSTSGGLPAFSVTNVRVTNSSVRLTNNANKADVKITDINFELPLISTLASAAESTLAPKLSLKIDGTPIEAHGTMKGETGTLNLTVSKLDAAKLLKAAPVDLGYKINSALVSAAFDVGFSIPKSGNAAVTAKGTVEAASVDVRQPSGAAFVSLDSAKVELENFDLAAKKVALKSVSVVKPSASLEINTAATSGTEAKGSAPAAKTSASASMDESSPASGWNWSVAQASVKSGAVKITDTGLKPAAALSVTDINVAAKNFSSAKGSSGTYTASAKLAGGKVDSSGSISLSPLAVNATTGISALGFSTFNPWIKANSGAQLTKGSATVDGKLVFKQSKTTDVTWAGNLEVNNLEAKNAAGKTLMTWTSAQAKSVDLKSISPVKLSIGELTVKEPAQKATKVTGKALGILSSIASLTGHDNTASRAQKAAEVVTSDITVKNISYENGKFSAGNLKKGALESLVIEALNNTFSKN